MKKHAVTVFKPYEFAIGQKIHIESGPRKGDWQVVDLTERKVTLQCPISLRTFTWDRFCYHIGNRRNVTWPQED